MNTGPLWYLVTSESQTLIAYILDHADRWVVHLRKVLVPSHLTDASVIGIKKATVFEGGTC